jgi:hypothetical protein
VSIVRKYLRVKRSDESGQGWLASILPKFEESFLIPLSHVLGSPEADLALGPELDRIQ